MTKSLFSIVFLLLSFVAQSSPINSEELFKNPENYDFKLSPNGRYISALTRQDSGYYFALFDRDNEKKLSSVLIGAETRVSSYYWLHDEAVWLNIVTGGLNRSVLLKVIDGVANTHLIKARGTFVDAYTPDKNKILFSKRSSSRSRFLKLYLVSIDDLLRDDMDNAIDLTPDLSNIALYSYDADSNQLFALKLNRKNKSVKVIYSELQSDKWTTLIEIDDTLIQLTPVAFLDSETLAVLTNENTDKVVLQEYNFVTKEFGDIVYQHPKYDLIDASYTREGKLSSVSFVRNGLTQHQYFEKDLSIQAKRFAKTFPGSEVFTIDTSDEGQVSLLYLNGSNIPGEYMIYDLKEDVIYRFMQEYENLEQEFSLSQPITVTSSDGSEIEAFLTKPNGTLDLNTLLVMPHGGPIGLQEYDYFNSQVQYFVSRGFSVLRVNFRGSSGFGKTFQEQGVGEFGKLIEQDISKAVSEVSKTHKFKHTCSMGASYGGYSAMMLAIQNPERYKCVVGAFGIYDLPFLFNASNLRSGEEFSKQISKVVGENNASLVAVSPVNLVEKIHAPVLLIAGRDDDRADFEHSNRMKYLLKKLGKPVETMFYDDTGHGHSTWFGDRHEAAFTYHFLMTTLGLDFPTPNSITQQEKDAIGNDFAIIADHYDSLEFSDENQGNAFNFYNKAVDYGHGRSAFNVGAIYHQGKIVERDPNKALEQYRISADMNYEGAHLRLGRILMEGTLKEQSWEKAKDLFEAAFKLEPGAKTSLWLARFYCSAPQPLQDIERCLTLLDISDYSNRPDFNKSVIRSLKRETLAWILAEAKVDKTQLAKITEYSTDYVKANVSGLSLVPLENGRFLYFENEKFGKQGELSLVEAGPSLHLEKKDEERIGVNFEIDRPGINSRKDVGAVAARITTVYKDQTKSYELHLLYGSTRATWSVHKSTKDLEQAETVKIEIVDLEQNPLFTTSYQISDKVESGEETVLNAPADE